MGDATEKVDGRPGFRQWIDLQPDPGWKLMPLTHVTKGIHAEDIIRSGKVTAVPCDVLRQPLAYFFYGRPAYRVSGDGAIKAEAACPYCFVFDPQLIGSAASIHAFDTGAFAKRMYQHILLEEMAIADFSLERDTSRPNRVIAAVFSTMQAYFDGDTTRIPPAEEKTKAWEFHARAYLQLLKSPGRNEPDDRVCTIEVVVGQDVSLKGNLKGVVVPHTLWDGSAGAPWLESLQTTGVEIQPYLFVPGRHPEHYHTKMESAVKHLYKSWGVL